MYLATIGSTPEYTVPIYSMPANFFEEATANLAEGPVNASVTVAGTPLPLSLIPPSSSCEIT